MGCLVSKTNPHGLKVGDKVVMAPRSSVGGQFNRGSVATERVITRVGRKFAYARREGHSAEVDIDLQTLTYGHSSHGYNFAGQTYLNMALYERARDRSIAYGNLESMVRNTSIHRLHELVTPQMIVQAGTLLGFDAEKILPSQPTYKDQQ